MRGNSFSVGKLNTGVGLDHTPVRIKRHEGRDLGLNMSPVKTYRVSPKVAEVSPSM